MLHDIIAVETELNRLDISQSTLCALTGIAAGSLSDIIRGVKKPGFEQEQAIYRALEGLDRLIAAVKPLQLDFKKTLQLKQQIDLLDAGRLRISVVVQEPQPEKDEPLSYIFLGSQYFAGRRPTVLGRFEVISTPYSGRAACMTEDCTARVISALSKLGYRGQRVPCKTANPDSFDQFEQVWGPEETVQQ